MEFLSNIWKWFVEHKDAVIAVLTSAQFVSFLTSVVLFVKALKKSNNTTSTQNNLTKSLEELNKSLEVISTINVSLQKHIEDSDNQNKITNDFIVETKETLDTLQDKINSMIDAQLNVWSTIKDENIRTNAVNILTNARYLETSNIVDMRNKINDLEQKLIDKANDIKKEVAETVKEVKKTVKSKNTVMRA